MTPFRELWFWIGLILYTVLACAVFMARLSNDRNMLTVFSGALIAEYVVMFLYGMRWRFR